MADEDLKLYTIPDQTDITNPIGPTIASDVKSTTPFATVLDGGQIKLTQGTLQSANFSTGVQGWQLKPTGNLEANNGNFRGDITGATGTFSGTVTVGSLNIPDSTTANSMHVDSSGNTWWGANVASGYANANAYVLNTGAIKFKNVQMGGTTIQYTIGDSGMYTFATADDGAAVFDGSTAVAGYALVGSTYTGSRDTYFTNATISTGVIVIPNGWRIFGTGTLTLNGTAIIKANGGTGGTGSSGAAGGGGGAAGSSQAAGYLLAVSGAPGGGNGGAGSNGAGNPGTAVAGGAVSNSLGSNGVTGGKGGDGGTGSSGAGGSGPSGAAGGVATAANVNLRAGWHLTTLLDIGASGSTAKYNVSAAGSAGSGGGSGGGDGGTSGAGAGGGGAGGNGGPLAIYFRNIVDNASSTISTNGGVGGIGGAGQAAPGGNRGGGGGGGGGSGGNGGELILVYNTFTNLGTVTASGGAGGAGGAGSAGAGTGTAGAAGATGSTGTAGTVRKFQVSL